jgi:hypothetical protein
VRVVAEVGAVMVTTGAVESRVTTSMSVLDAPRVSVAVTTIVFGPVASAIEATVHPVVPVAAPEDAVVVLAHVTEVRPAVALAVPARAMVAAAVATVDAAVGEVMAIVGPGVSRVTVSESVVVAPTASVAVTVMTFAPGTSAMALAVHVVVPVATPLVAFALLVQDTEVSSLSSDAVPPSVSMTNGVEYVGSVVGVVIAMLGAAASRRMAITTVVELPTLSVAMISIALAPAASGMASIDHVVVPVAIPLVAVVVFVHATSAMPAGSAAPPAAVVAVDVVMVASAGLSIVSVGPASSSVTVRLAMLDSVLPSTAVTTMAFSPTTSGTVAVQIVVPVAEPDAPLVVFLHVTLAICDASEAVPVSSIVASAVTPEGALGAIIVTSGSMPSGTTSSVPSGGASAGWPSMLASIATSDPPSSTS